MVDSIPWQQGPPSSMKGIRPPSSLITCSAVVGLIRPNRLALGAARGLPKPSTTERNAGWALILTATVS